MAGPGSEVVFSIGSSECESREWYQGMVYLKTQGLLLFCLFLMPNSVLGVKVRMGMKYRKLWLESKNFQIGNWR